MGYGVKGNWIGNQCWNKFVFEVESSVKFRLYQKKVRINFFFNCFIILYVITCLQNYELELWNLCDSLDLHFMGCTDGFITL